MKPKLYLALGHSPSSIEVITMDRRVHKGPDFWLHATQQFAALIECRVPGVVFDRIIYAIADECELDRDWFYERFGRVVYRLFVDAHENPDCPPPAEESEEEESEEEETAPEIGCRHLRS